MNHADHVIRKLDVTHVTNDTSTLANYEYLYTVMLNDNKPSRSTPRVKPKFLP